MADNSIFSRLKKLFSTNTVVRNVGGKKLRIADTDQIQSFVNRRGIDRYHRVYNSATGGYGSSQGRYEAAAAFQGARLQLFRDYDMMDNDPIISSILDIYADECVGGSTQIPLLDGTVQTIKSLYENNITNFWVYSIDSNGIFIPAQCERVAYNGKKHMYKITLDDGSEITATENHLWVRSDGSFIYTSDLQLGTSLKVIPKKVSSNSDTLNGYEMLKQDGMWEYTHRLIGRSWPSLIEQRIALGNTRKVIHHKSFDKRNNNPDQLEWLDMKTHHIVHAEFNKALWSDDNKTHVYKDKIKTAHAKYWTPERRQAVADRQRKFMQLHVSSLDESSRKTLYGHSGSSNGMWKNGDKLRGERNGRYRRDINRVVDLPTYISAILKGATKPELVAQFGLTGAHVVALNKEVCRLHNVTNIKTLRKLNRISASADIVTALRTYVDSVINLGQNPLRTLKPFLQDHGLRHEDLNTVLHNSGYPSYSEFVSANNHRVVSIEYVGEEDAYDLVNVGESHVYAIQVNDGSMVFCHNCTVKDEFNRVLTIKTDDTKIQEILHNLFYDILNIEFNLQPWIRNMAKYGDFFLYLDIDPEYGIVNVIPLSVYETIRVEGEDPKNPFSVRFEIQNDFLGLGKTEFENYEVAHFRLLADTNFLPYGKAIIEGGRRTWKQLQLMEDAMLIHRIMRAPDKRKFKIDIGNIPPAEVETYMQRIIDRMKKIPLVDPKTGDYNLRYNMMNITEDFYLPVRGKDSGTEIETMQGLQFNAIEDIEYLRNKLLAAFKVPKSFIGYEEDVNGKATLAAQDVRFARTIERVQRIMISELTKIAIIHLYVQGFTDETLINFELSLTNPSTLYEQEKINIWKEKFALAKDMTGGQTILFSQDWVYNNILEMSDDEIQKEREKIKEDLKRQQEQQAAMQPPMPGGPEGGTIPPEGAPPDGQQPDSTEEEPVSDEEAQIDDVDQILSSLEDMEDDEESELEEILMKRKGGRPPEGLKFGTDRHPLGRDPLGHKENKKATTRTLSGEARHFLASLKRSGMSKYKQMITETIVNDDKTDG